MKYMSYDLRCEREIRIRNLALAGHLIPGDSVTWVPKLGIGVITEFATSTGLIDISRCTELDQIMQQHRYNVIARFGRSEYKRVDPRNLRIAPIKNPYRTFVRMRLAESDDTRQTRRVMAKIKQQSRRSGNITEPVRHIMPTWHLLPAQAWEKLFWRLSHLRSWINETQKSYADIGRDHWTVAANYCLEQRDLAHRMRMGIYG